jgi:hypothetical protein
MDWYDETFRLTVVLLAASVLVIVPGLAGFGGSFLLVVVAVLVGSGLYAGRDQLRTAPEVGSHDFGDYGDVLWLSAVVAAAVFLFGLSATPGELRALGGIVGLLGMLNYFLRPLYRLFQVLYRAFLGTTA